MLLIVAVAVAKGLRAEGSVQRFIRKYPGTIASSNPQATTGFPVWAPLAGLADRDGWPAYNALQLIAYFITVFVAAPLAPLTGLGMSPALSTRFKRVSRILSIQTARSLHFLVCSPGS